MVTARICGDGIAAIVVSEMLHSAFQLNINIIFSILLNIQKVC
jgi:hypothetical protein